MLSPSFTSEQKEKLGNSLLYLTQGKSLNKTQLLKLTYLLDEYSIKERGIPYFNFLYKVWQFGPVKRDLFVDLSNEKQYWFGDYISLNGNQFQPKEGVEFVDDEFSDYEIDLLKKIKDQFSKKWASDLVKATHERIRPWYIVSRDNGLLESFRKGEITSTDFDIDMKVLIKNDDYKLQRYQEYLENFGEPN